MRIYIGNSGWKFGYMAATYPARLGWIMTPHDFRYPDPRIPYVFDNGVWSDCINSREFDRDKFFKVLDKTIKRQKPEWICVPDKVADRDETLKLWDEYAEGLAGKCQNLMMVVQDGMTPSDVPSGIHGIFVGGSTDWKWNNLDMWNKNFEHVHVGRVNTYRMLCMAHESGAESVDGSGWFRGDQNQIEGLEEYLKETQNNKHLKQQTLL